MANRLTQDILAGGSTKTSLPINTERQGGQTATALSAAAGQLNVSSQTTKSGNNSDIPKTCRAGCVGKTGANFTISVEDVQVPTPGPNELLLKLNATGICYSDLHYMLEDIGMPSMSIFGVRSPGHEGAGVVVAVGSAVNPDQWKVGDRGGVKPMWDTCGACELCWDGVHETYCAKAVGTGLMVAGKLL